MRSQGKSEKEIYKAKMELIQKYCEKYDLDSIDVLKSKAVQNSMVQQINASINKVKTFKEVIVEGAKSGFRWVGEKTGALWNWAVSNKGAIFTGIAVIGTVAAIYFSAGAILPLIKSIYGAGLINGIIAVSATIKPALLMATTSAMFSNTVLVIKSLIGEEMTKIDKVLAVVNAVVLMGSSLANAAIEAASIYDKFNGQSKGAEVKGTGSGYEYNMVENPGPLAEINPGAAATFESGKYNVKTLETDTIYYRGGDSNGSPLGQYFTSEIPESVANVRVDSAVKPQWIDPQTGVLTGTSPIDSVYAVKIPSGTVVYSGPTGYQGGIYLGGLEQIFVPTPWNIEGVEVIFSKPLK